jgi:hypothetical protein
MIATTKTPAPSLSPAWLPAVRRDLAGLGLTPEWPAESVAVPGDRARRAAECSLGRLADYGLRPDRIFPSLDGGVALAFAAADRYAEVEFLDSGEVLATCSAADGDGVRVWPVHADLAGTLDRIASFLAG